MLLLTRELRTIRIWGARLGFLSQFRLFYLTVLRTGIEIMLASRYAEI
jgi:hypothetical protein